jgi:hypothetical protein
MHDLVNKILRRHCLPSLTSDCVVSRDNTGEFIIKRGEKYAFLRFNSTVNEARAAWLCLR